MSSVSACVDGVRYHNGRWKVYQALSKARRSRRLDLQAQRISKPRVADGIDMGNVESQAIGDPV